MTRMAFFAVAVAAAAVCVPAHAQSRDQRRAVQGSSPAMAILNSVPADQQPDVVLDIPSLAVESIALEVEGLEANVALDARLADLLKLTAGADVSLDSVKLDIKGVQAQAALIVRLDNVRAIIERTLQTLDNNPQFITQLTGSIDQAASAVGSVAKTAVSSVEDLTQGLLRSGAFLDLSRSGLSAVSETVDTAGHTVRRLRAGDGQLYEVITDATNKIVSSRRLAS